MTRKNKVINNKRSLSYFKKQQLLLKEEDQK